MDDSQEPNQGNTRAENNSIAIGGISVGGNVGDIRIGHVIGYSAEQVSLLLTQIKSEFQSKAFDGRCPYKGLEVFEEEDAELFFGRERLIEDLLSRVRDSRTVFITGPSGSGKSSLVRAGLIHALRQDKIQGSGRWLCETMKPGREPVKELALAFSRLKGPDLADYFQAHAGEAEVLNKCAESVLRGNKDQRFVLFMDQFEEVFTQVSREDERLAFINMLAHAGTAENGRVIVLFAMRSDFVSNCATYPALNELLSQEFRQIGAMQPEELVSAIALPARHVGLPIEDELIARIINDMKGEPGALPLMQFALKDLFDAQQEQGGVIALRLEDYLQQGGIHKSLERHADATFARLHEDEQQLARSIFSGLIEIGRGTQDTRRTALFDELVPSNAQSQDVLAVVQKLADARLVITDEQAGTDTVTISHEKLIDAWPWLKKLVNENREVIALQNEIAADAKEWQDHNRDESYLYTGARLANAREQLEANKLVLSGLAEEFIEAGMRAHTDELAAAAGRIRRFRILTFGLLLALVAAGFLGFVAQQQAGEARLQASIANTNVAIASTNESLAILSRDEAEASQNKAQEQTTIARAGELAANAVSQRDAHFDLSLLLSVEAFRTADTTRTRGVLLDNTQSNLELVKYLRVHSDSVMSVAFSPECDSPPGASTGRCGKTLASGSDDSTIILWDVDNEQPIGQPLKGHSDTVNSVAFSPDGKILASAGADNQIILWDVASQKPIGQPLKSQGGSFSVAFSPDGNTLALGSFDGTVILWNVTSHQPIGRPLQGHTGSVSSVAFSPDGKTLASGSYDDTVILWDVANGSGQLIGQPLKGYSNPVNSVAFSPDGRTLASGSGDNFIILWDVATHQTIDQPLESQGGSSDVAFSPDGKTLASASYDNTIILWDLNTHQSIGRPLRGHSSPVTSVAFSPDGKTLASASYDKAIILWDISTLLNPSEARPSGQPFGPPLQGHSGFVNSVDFSTDGKTLASGSADWTIMLWDVTSHESIGQPLRGHSNSVSSVALSPDGKTLASGSEDSTIILWDTASQKPIGQPLKGYNAPVLSLAFSPDGKTLASGSCAKTTQRGLCGQGEIILWDAETHQPIGQPLKGHSDQVLSIAFSPDDKTLASGSRDQTIIMWDVESQEPIGQPFKGHSNQVTSVAFSPDGKTLASGSWDATIILWDMGTHQPTGQPLKGDNAPVNSVAFSPDGNTLASGSWENTIILWDMASGQPIGQPLKGHNAPVSSVAFSPDGNTLASGSWDYTVILWDLNPETWVKKICQRASRNFTRTEWERYFPNEEYRKTCEQWPLEPELTSTPTP